MNKKHLKQLSDLEHVESEYTGYFITRCGKIWSEKTKKYMTPQYDTQGYLRFCLSRGHRGTSIMLKVHRLIARTFIPNPDSKPFVNHKNGIKDDNRVENLEWISSRDNQLHAYQTGLKEKKSGAKNGMAKKITDKGGNIFNTITEASIKYNIHRSNLSNILKGKRKNNYGFRYINK